MMRVSRRVSRRAAAGGLALVLLGAWGALIPYVGPAFGWVIGADDTWDWTAGRFWLSLLPGVVTVLGGLLVAGFADRSTVRRSTGSMGATLAAAAGAWFVVGPTVSRLWNDGIPQTGAALGGTTQQVLEQLSYFSALGVLIVMLAMRLTGRVARPVVDEPAHDRRAYASYEEPMGTQEESGPGDSPLADGEPRRMFARRRRRGPRRGTRVDQ